VFKGTSPGGAIAVARFAITKEKMEVPSFILNINKKSRGILKTDSQNPEEIVSGNRTYESSVH
jgi:hypothetical protein